MFRLCVIAASLILSVPQDGDYTFTVDGEPFTPRHDSLHGDSETMREGDVVHIQHVPLLLGKSGNHRFNKMEYNVGELKLNDELVGVVVRNTYIKRKKTLINPLQDLKPAQIAKLRGIKLDAWNEEIAAALKHVNPKTCVITVTQNTKQAPKDGIPELPEDLLYLNIDQSSNRGFHDGTALEKLTKLKYFSFPGWREGFDADLIRNATSLRFLNLTGQELSNAGRLAAMTDVRDLRLGRSPKLSDVGFVKGMKKLRRLEINNTDIDDLTMLSGLSELEYVNANLSKVETLPTGKLPKLKKLLALSCGLEKVAAFQKANPDCLLMYSWTKALADAVNGVDRIRVRTGGTCHRRPGTEKTIFEVKKKDEIRKVMGFFKMQEKGDPMHCMCCGSPSIEFYRKGELLVTLGVHHGRSMRWHGGWPGDGQLTKDSRAEITQWLKDGGVKMEK